MLKQVKFYLLDNFSGDQLVTMTGTELTTAEYIACDLAADAWRLGKRVLIACDTEQQALAIDEALWQRDADEFVPHNLSGEITTYATPIEICWPNKRNSQRRDLLINLQNVVPEFISSFNHIIDFVPADETQKAIARERYKQYRQLGCQLSTEQI